jgi:D-alanyl-D-alanine endopeptidase (penicillin-binding protein 7)
MRFFIGLLLAVAMVGVSAKTTKAATAPLAKSWMIWDIDRQRTISYENVEQVRSIASVTKLMTVMVTLDNSDLSEMVPITRYRGYTTHIPPTTKTMTRLELVNLAMITSDNLAAHLLAMTYKDGFDAFVIAMNKKALSLGMKDTRYVEATGLLAANVSTAVDLNAQVMAAMKYPVIVEASKSSTSEVRAKKRFMLFHNTNPLVGSPRKIIVSKTGWINASGGCLVMAVETSHGLRSIIILGSKSTRTRIADALFIMDRLDAPSPTVVERVIEPFDSILYH